MLRRRGVRATSINWDVWRGAGMAVDADLPESLRAGREAELVSIGLDPESRLSGVVGESSPPDIGHVMVSRRRDFAEASAIVVHTDRRSR